MHPWTHTHMQIKSWLNSLEVVTLQLICDSLCFQYFKNRIDFLWRVSKHSLVGEAYSHPPPTLSVLTGPVDIRATLSSGQSRQHDDITSNRYPRLTTCSHIPHNTCSSVPFCLRSSVGYCMFVGLLTGPWWHVMCGSVRIRRLKKHD